VTPVVRGCESCLKKTVSNNPERLDWLMALALSTARRARGHPQCVDSHAWIAQDDAVMATIIRPPEVDRLSTPGRLGKSDLAICESLWKKGIIPKLRNQRLGLDRATFF